MRLNGAEIILGLFYVVKTYVFFAWQPGFDFFKMKQVEFHSARTFMFGRPW